jgi:Uma2 family endonuclease
MVSTASRIKTYDDYLNTPDDGRIHELFDGAIFVSPTPNQRHQWIASGIHLLVASYVRANKLGRVAPSPLAIRLSSNIVLEPDLLFVRSGSPADNLSTTWIEGAPALVVEILPKSTADRDLNRKRELYEQYGVEEYWIVDPVQETILALTLVDGRYQPISVEDSRFASLAIPGLEIDVTDLFAQAF